MAFEVAAQAALGVHADCCAVPEAGGGRQCRCIGRLGVLAAEFADALGALVGPGVAVAAVFGDGVHLVDPDAASLVAAHAALHAVEDLTPPFAPVGAVRRRVRVGVFVLPLVVLVGVVKHFAQRFQDGDPARDVGAMGSHHAGRKAVGQTVRSVGGEKRIAGFPGDGYIPSQKKVLQFHGWWVFHKCLASYLLQIAFKLFPVLFAATGTAVESVTRTQTR